MLDRILWHGILELEGRTVRADILYSPPLEGEARQLIMQSNRKTRKRRTVDYTPKRERTQYPAGTIGVYRASTNSFPSGQFRRLSTINHEKDS